MKYDDDELAEAALLLAHTEDRGAMPSAVAERIAAKVPELASEVRFSTTKGAAVEIEAPIVPLRRRPAGVGAWAGWLAAAACFALAVYEWRSATLAREGRAAAAAPLVLHDGTGASIAALGCADGRLPCTLTVRELPPNAPAEQYVVWASGDGARQAVAIGTLTCAERCRDRVLAIPGDRGAGRVAAVWVTRERIGAPPAGLVEERVVGTAVETR